MEMSSAPRRVPGKDHSCIQQVFVECLPDARHCSMCQGTSVIKTLPQPPQKKSSLKELSFQRWVPNTYLRMNGCLAG